MTIDSQSTRRTAILVKTEAAYGEDAVPTAAENAVLINEGVDLTPQADRVDRTILRDTFSPAGSAIGSRTQDLSFQTEARGGGLNGDSKPLPPDYAPALLACGMQAAEVMRLSLAAPAAFVAGETITGGTSAATAAIEYVERDALIVVRMTNGEFQPAETVTGDTSAATAGLSAIVPGLMYRPITARPAAQVSDSIHYYKDSLLHRVVGARGSWSLDAQVGKFATFDFKFSGIWTDPIDQVMPGLALTNLTGPQLLGADLQVGNYVPVFTALKVDLGNKIEKRQDANSLEGVIGQIISSRSPTGTLDPEADKLANHNPWSYWRDASARQRINCTIGDTPGNRLVVHMGSTQLTDLKYGDRVGLAVYNMSFTPCQERTGDDEIRLVYF